MKSTDYSSTLTENESPSHSKRYIEGRKFISVHEHPTYDLTERYHYHGAEKMLVDVELLEPVEFVTHMKHYRYTKGLQRIPFDLAKMLFRLQKARRPGQSKTVPIAKQGRF